MSLDIPYQAPLPILLGGTGASTLAGAQANLGIGGGSGAYTVVTSEAELATAIANSAPAIAIAATFSLTSDHTVLVTTEFKVLPGFTFDLDDFAIISTVGLTIIFFGSSVVSWARTTSTNPIQLGAAAVLVCIGMALFNFSAVNNTSIATSTEGQEYYFTRFFSGGNSGDCISCNNTLRMTQCSILLDTGSQSVLTSSGLIFITDLLILGDATPTTGILVSLTPTATNGSYIKGFRDESFQGAGSSMNVRSDLITDFTVIENKTINFSANLAGFAPTIKGVVAQAGTVNLAPSTDLQVFGVECDTLQMPAFNGCKVFGAVVAQLVTMDGPFAEIHGGFFEAGISITTGDDCLVQGATCGDRAGGGAGTLTIAATADRCKAVGLSTDAAISDSGVGTALAANNVF